MKKERAEKTFRQIRTDNVILKMGLGSMLFVTSLFIFNAATRDDTVILVPPFQHETIEFINGRASYTGFWVIRPDQAARFSAPLVATPSVNVTPSMSKGNWFAPFRRRHVLAAA